MRDSPVEIEREANNDVMQACDEERDRANEGQYYRKRSSLPEKNNGDGENDANKQQWRPIEAK